MNWFKNTLRGFWNTPRGGSFESDLKGARPFNLKDPRYKRKPGDSASYDFGGITRDRVDWGMKYPWGNVLSWTPELVGGLGLAALGGWLGTPEGYDEALELYEEAVDKDGFAGDFDEWLKMISRGAR